MQTPDDLTEKLTIAFPKRVDKNEAQELFSYVAAKVPARVNCKYHLTGESTFHGREAETILGKTTAVIKRDRLSLQGTISSYDQGTVFFSTPKNNDLGDTRVGTLVFANSVAYRWEEVPTFERTIIDKTRKTINEYFAEKAKQGNVQDYTAPII